MTSIFFYSNNCNKCKKIRDFIKLKKLEKYFNMKLIEEIDIEEILMYGIEIVPTIINNEFYYENETECIEFVNGLTTYITYNENKNLVVKSVNTINDPENICTICLNEIEVGESIHTFSCSHQFHENCSINWRKTKNVCPICGKNLLAAKV